MFRKRAQRDTPSSRTEHRDDEALYASAEEVGRGQPLVAGLVVGVLVVLTVVLVWAQNGQTVSFEWLFVDASVPLWGVAFGGAVVGALAAGAGLMIWRGARNRSIVRRSALDRLESRQSDGSQQSRAA